MNCSVMSVSQQAASILAYFLTSIKKGGFCIIPQNHISCPATEKSHGSQPEIQLGLKQQSCERLISLACMGLSPMGGGVCGSRPIKTYTIKKKMSAGGHIAGH